MSSAVLFPDYYRALTNVTIGGNIKKTYGV